LGGFFLIIGGIFIFIYSLLPPPNVLKRKRSNYNKSFWGLMERLGDVFPFKYLQLKEGGDDYKEILKLLEDNSLNISVKAYITFMYVFGMFTLLLSLFFLLLSNNSGGSLDITTLRTINPNGIVSFNNSNSGQPDTMKYIYTLAFGFSGILMPRYFVKYYGRYINNKIEDELQIIEIYTLILVQAQKPAKDIIYELTKLTKYTKDAFIRAANEYSTNPESAFTNLRNRINNEQFKMFITMFQESLVSNNYLVKHIERHLETLRNNKYGKGRRRTGILSNFTMLFIIFPLIALAIFGIWPWLVFAMSNL
jgi:nitrate reductase NapE component